MALKFSMVHFWNNADKRKPKYPATVHLCTKNHVKTCPGLNLGLRVEKPSTDYPRYAMATNIEIIFTYKRLSNICHGHEYSDYIPVKILSKICHGHEYSYYIHV
jgi:hypothetical protein